MGLGGISVWQLILILVIVVCTLLAVPLVHGGDAPPSPKIEEGDEAPEEDEPEEEPPLGVG